MELLNARVAGLDVHQASVVATVRVPGDVGARLMVTETAGQCRFFEVPIRKVPNADGSLTHALSWVIPRATFTLNGE